VNYLIAILKLTRVFNGLVAAATLVVAVYLATGRISWPVTEMIALFLIVSFGYAINDLFDYRIDRVNKPKRVLPAGEISRQTAVIIAAVCLPGGLGLALLSPMPVILYFGLLALLLVHYAFSLSAIPVVGNLIVALMGSSVFYLGGLIAQTDERGWSLLFAATILAFIHHLAREVVKDMEDIEGDRRAGRRTLAILIGPTGTAVVAAILLAFLIAATYILYEIFYFHSTYLALVTLGVNVPLVLIYLYFIMPRRPELLTRASLLLKLTMLTGLAALVAAR
jgi:geranylgeranylglycerol-phosphate geranylgeranyltransferase